MKKYQIFVSSTYLDLIEERAQVTKAILEIGHIPVGMEMFSASDETQWKLIQRQIDDCDYYVVVVAHKYGSRDPIDGRSYTEKEYDYAVSKGIPVLGFVIESGAPWQPTKMDKDGDLVSLNLFKDKVKSKMVKFWTNKEVLHAAIVASLSVYFTLNPRVGWIKSSEGTDPSVLNEVSRLSSENASLREQVEAFTQATNSEKIEKIDKMLICLHKQKIDIHIKYVNTNEYIFSSETENLTVFRILAPELLTNNSLSHCSTILAYGTHKTDGKLPHEIFPVPKNVISKIIANYVALELIIVCDNKNDAYYKLSEFGLDIFKKMVKFEFEDQVS